MLTKVALLTNMMSQLSKTVPGVILSFPEQFIVASKNTSYFMYKIMRKSTQKNVLSANFSDLMVFGVPMISVTKRYLMGS